MLDISIKNANTVLTTNEKIISFLNQSSKIEEKVDGIKITLVRNGKKFNQQNFSSNFILAYKGTIIYDEDHAAIIEKNVKRHSIGIAQYSLIYNHLKRFHSNYSTIPKNTEFFLEFLVEKPTITRDYKIKHRIVLIGYSPCTFTEEGGKLNTKPGELYTEKINDYATIFKIDAPREIVNGDLYPYEKLFLSTTDPLFSESLLRNADKFNYGDVSPEEHYGALHDLLLELPSKYGGMIEGVIIEQKNIKLKIIQFDQHDKDTRRRKKERFEMTADREQLYFSAMKALAREVLDNGYDTEANFLVKNSAMSIPKNPLTFKERLKKLSYTAYQSSEIIKFFPHHDKKSLFQKQEDFHYLLKYLFLKDLVINNNAIFIGRLQPPSKKHIQIISHGLQEYNRIVIALVKGKKTEISQNPFSFETQSEIIHAAFPNNKNIEIIQVASGNLFSAIEKSGRNINAILCGEDRRDNYSKQLSKNPEIKLLTFSRNKDGVSGTKIREAIINNDRETFNKNVDITTKVFFHKLKFEIDKVYKDHDSHN